MNVDRQLEQANNLGAELSAELAGLQQELDLAHAELGAEHWSKSPLECHVSIDARKLIQARVAISFLGFQEQIIAHKDRHIEHNISMKEGWKEMYLEMRDDKERLIANRLYNYTCGKLGVTIFHPGGKIGDVKFFPAEHQNGFLNLDDMWGTAISKNEEFVSYDLFSSRFKAVVHKRCLQFVCAIDNFSDSIEKFSLKEKFLNFIGIDKDIKND